MGKPPTFRVAPDRIRFDGHVEVGVRMAHEICRRLNFSNDDTEQIEALVANHMRFADVERMKESTLKRFLRLPRVRRAHGTASHGLLSEPWGLDALQLRGEKLRSTPPEQIRPEPLLSGRELIELGYAPGPRFKEILSAVEDAQLEGRLRSREEALELVKREFPRVGLIRCVCGCGTFG